MKKSIVIHPFLFAIFPVLFLFAHNIRQVSFSEVVLPIIVALSFTLLLLLLVGLFVRDRRKAGIIVSIFLIFFFSYGHIYGVVEYRQIGSFVAGRHRYLLLVWNLLLASSIYFIIRTRKQLHNLTKIFNVVAVSLVLISLVNIVSYELKTKVVWQDIKGKKDIETGVINSRQDVLPDIYYIVLDKYASAKILKKIYDFDNSDFINYLSNKGFYVVPNSNSNYPITLQSLPSSLNMEFINYLTEILGRESNNERPLYAMVENNKVLRFLKSKGYKYVHFGTHFKLTGRNRYADINVNLVKLPEFAGMLFSITMLCPIFEKLGILNYRKDQWERVLYKFDKLAEIPKIEGPTFVFAHMVVPHKPYVFDRNGNFVTKEEANKRSEKENYINQLIFVNKKVKILIYKILSSSEIPPVIILQGDEGPDPARFARNQANFNWKRATEAELQQKMGILNAYYLPHADKNVLYPSITPVNSFRVIFNLYFNTNLELLPDESYAFVNMAHPYQFFNITDKLRSD